MHRLTALQRRILRVLSALSPPWTLTGGGARAGVHLGHRSTRDFDLFWRNRRELGDLVRAAVVALAADDLQVHPLRTAPSYGELRVADDRDVWNRNRKRNQYNGIATALALLRDSQTCSDAEMDYATA